MTTSALPQTESPDIAAMAEQNDAFRKLACLGETPSQPIQGRMHLTSSLAMAEDGLALEAVQAVGEFDVFEPENDPDGCHDSGAVDTPDLINARLLDAVDYVTEIETGVFNGAAVVNASGLLWVGMTEEDRASLAHAAQYAIVTGLDGWRAELCGNLGDGMI